jgi:hypothetical protein
MDSRPSGDRHLHRRRRRSRRLSVAARKVARGGDPWERRLLSGFRPGRPDRRGTRAVRYPSGPVATIPTGRRRAGLGPHGRTEEPRGAGRTSPGNRRLAQRHRHAGERGDRPVAAKVAVRTMTIVTLNEADLIRAAQGGDEGPMPAWPSVPMAGVRTPGRIWPTASRSSRSPGRASLKRPRP